jgi:hypothetical protein
MTNRSFVNDLHDESLLSIDYIGNNDNLRRSNPEGNGNM